MWIEALLAGVSMDRDGSRLTNFNLCQDIQKGSPFSINLTYLMRF